MKLIEYDYLKSEEKEKEKCLFLKNGDIIHLVHSESPHEEIVIICTKNSYEILSKQDYINKKKKNL